VSARSPDLLAMECTFVVYRFAEGYERPEAFVRFALLVIDNPSEQEYITTGCE
jgi:hypothetical protein